jgi:Family of unknown function (DUF6941)
MDSLQPCCARTRTVSAKSMKIDLATLCDAAVEVNGRLNVLGTIDYFWAASVPYIYPKCCLALRLRWDGYERAKKHKVRVTVVDADGLAIASEFSRKILAPATASDDVPAIRHILVQFEDLSFENFGPYAVRVEVDGEELACIPFSIVAAGNLRRETAS